jgi:hypothetical protein
MDFACEFITMIPVPYMAGTLQYQRLAFVLAISVATCLSLMCREFPNAPLSSVARPPPVNWPLYFKAEDEGHRRDPRPFRR